MVRKKTGSTDADGITPETTVGPEPIGGTEPPVGGPATPPDTPLDTPESPLEPETAHDSSSFVPPPPASTAPEWSAPPVAPPEEPEDAAVLDAVDAAVVAHESEQPARDERFSEPEPEPDPAPAPSEPPREVHEEHAEESGGGFAARVLTWLAILLVGAGLALWGAPKLAPMLPAGMAPVAGWLTPGLSQAETRIAGLETRLDADLGSVRAQVADVTSGPALDARIGAAVSEAETRLGGEIAGLRDQLGQTEGVDTRQRLARLEAAIDGQVAELTTLKDQIAGGAAAASGEAVAQIDVYRAELDGLRAEMGALSDKVGGLGARIDEVAAEADRQIETAQTKVAKIETEASTAVDAATLRSDLAQVRAAVAAGQPFTEPLERLAGDPGVTIPESLTAGAGAGIASLAQLRDGFGDAAHQAIRASILAGAGEGVLARSRALVTAQIASRSLTPQEGQGPDAVLSRMEDQLRQDDLAGAVAEADQLPSEAAQAMSAWLDAARLRVDAEAGLETLTADIPATN